MNCSTPGLPVHHQLPELAQTRVHQVGDAIQPSHPLPSPSHAFNLSQHQGLFPDFLWCQRPIQSAVCPLGVSQAQLFYVSQTGRETKEFYAVSYTSLTEGERTLS